MSAWRSVVSGWVSRKAGRRGLVDARDLLQPREERRHRVHVVARVLQDLEADAIGLALRVAPEVELVLDRVALPRRHRGLARVRGPALDRDDHAEQRGRERDQVGLLLARDRPRDVALDHVPHLVRHHRRDFGLRLRRDDQARVHADVSAGQRECVDAGVIDEEELEVLRRVARPRVRDQRGAELVEVLGRLGVLHHVAGLVGLAHDLVAELAFGRRREVVAGRVAEVGQQRTRRQRRRWRCRTEHRLRRERPVEREQRAHRERDAAPADGAGLRCGMRDRAGHAGYHTSPLPPTIPPRTRR